MENLWFFLSIVVVLFVIALSIYLNNKPDVIIKRKITASKYFPEHREINSSKNLISVSAFTGHREKPDHVDVWEFDLEKKEACFYQNTDNGKRILFSGPLEVGLERLNIT